MKANPLEEIQSLKDQLSEYVQKEQLYQLLASKTGQLYYVYNIANGSIEWHGAIPELTGFSVEEFSKFGIEEWESLIHPDDKLKTLRILNRRLEDKKRFIARYRFKTKTGKYVYVEDNGFFINPNNSGDLLVGTMKDSSALLYVINHLKNSRTLYKSIFSYSKDALFIIDDHGNIIDANKSAQRIYGYNLTEMRQLKSIDLIHKDFHDDYFKLIIQNKGKEVFSLESLDVTKTGNKINVEILGVKLKLKDKNAFLIHARDITEQKKAKAQLSELQRQKEAILNNIPDVIWLKDTDSRLILVNNAYAEALGLTTKDVIGKTDHDFWPKDVADKFVKVDGDILKTKKPNRFFEKIELGNKTKWFDTVITPLFDSNGEIVGTVGSTRDITDLKNTEIELKKAKIKAEESDKLKSTFLASMSHELRTPLNGILGFSELLMNLDNLEKVKDYAKIINSSGKQLLEIIEDLFDISLIEVGKVNVSYEEFDVNLFFEELFLLYKERQINFSKENITFNFKDKESKNPKICTDKKRLTQIITNLLNNAFKFTHQGEIVFGYTLDNDWIEIYVQDTGLGISQEAQTYIFDNFRQADESMSRKHGGTGLGLAIVKKSVELLNGTILLQSELDQGSTFTIRLPIKYKDCKCKQKEIVFSNNLNILVAEDDNTNALYIREILDIEGYNITIVKNGLEAVEVLKKDCNYDIVLMDINMPVMDGKQSLQEIRKFNTQIPIIAQTAFAIKGDEGKLLKLGFNDYISKPMNPEDLILIINKNVSTKR